MPVKPNPLNQLVLLLEDLFTTVELKIFIGKLDDTLLPHLPNESTTLKHYTFETALILLKQGYVDEDLFKCLEENFPKKNEIIEKCRAELLRVNVETDAFRSLEQAITEFNDLRCRLPKGSERTRRLDATMSTIAFTMKDAVSDVPEQWLIDPVLGYRVAKYLALGERAEPGALANLLHAVEFAEPAWFGKYWALRMADRVLRTWTARRVPLACWWTLERLKGHPSVPEGSNRAVVLDGIDKFLAEERDRLMPN